jgi:hypothetical protein
MPEWVTQPVKPSLVALFGRATSIDSSLLSTFIVFAPSATESAVNNISLRGQSKISLKN